MSALLADGARVVSESWGARLELPEGGELDAALDRLRALVARAVEAGLVVRELESAAELLDLESATRGDYPDGPATPRPSDEDVDRVLREGRVFGAYDGELLVGATAIERLPDRAETAFTSVRAGQRGRGVASAVKAASVIALAAEGVRTFGTGGAGSNAASLGMNRAVGYRITERWVTLTAPQ